MIRDCIFSSKTDMWETPQQLFDELDHEFKFTIDVCATPENAKCKKFYTEQENGLIQPWIGTIWCNPPYGRQIKDWVCRAFLTAQTGQIVVMLLPARTDTKWFHEYIYNHKNVEIRFIKGRLKFGRSKNSAPFPSMIVVFNGNSTTPAVDNAHVVRCEKCANYTGTILNYCIINKHYVLP